MQRTYKEILQDLSAQQYVGVYLLSGIETYFIDLIAKRIEENVLDETAKVFDQTIVYGKDLPGADISPVISDARGFPMMGTHKVIIVREAQNIKKWDALTAYLDNMMPSTILVLCYKYSKPDARLSVFKKCKDAKYPQVAFCVCEHLPAWEVSAWVKNYMQNYLKKLNLNKSIAPNVPDMLVDNIGNDLAQITSAVHKLLEGCPENVTTIDATLVERNVGISKDYNVFELRDALIQGDALKAYRIAKYFASSKDHPMVKEMIILFNFFANLMLYHYLPNKSNIHEVATKLGERDNAIKNYELAARRFNASKTLFIIRYFRETDAKLKGINNPSAKDADLWKELLFKILN